MSPSITGLPNSRSQSTSWNSVSKSKISDKKENFKSVDLVKPWDKLRGIKYDLFGNGKIAIREGKFLTFKKARKVRIGDIKFE